MIVLRTTRLLLTASLVLGLVAGGAAPVAAGAAVTASTDPPSALNLARPAGPYLTGTTLVHLRDKHRIDPLDPQHRPRELMVQLWYPASAAAGRPLAPYAPPGEVAGLQEFYAVPAGAFSATTHSRVGAPVLPGNHKVVFFNHGLCGARVDTTAIDEQMASLGFIVVALADTHEAWAVQFPGGRVEKTTDQAFCAAGGDPFSAGSQAILQRLLDVRVADDRYVLDQLEAINRGRDPDAEGAPLPHGLARSMDTTRVGIFGHSFGGSTAAAVMREDRRFVVGANLDGLLVGPVAVEGLDRPFLVLGSDYHAPGQDPSWSTFLPKLTGWHRWIRYRQAGHYRFIDLGGSTHKWGLDTTLKQADPQTWRLVFGDVDDATSQEIVVRLTAAFFQQFLLRQPEPILDRPNEFYPELERRL